MSETPSEHVTGVTVRHEGKPSGLGQLTLSDSISVESYSAPRVEKFLWGKFPYQVSCLFQAISRELRGGKTVCQCPAFAARNFDFSSRSDLTVDKGMFATLSDCG